MIFTTLPDFFEYTTKTTARKAILIRRKRLIL